MTSDVLVLDEPGLSADAMGVLHDRKAIGERPRVAKVETPARE